MLIKKSLNYLMILMLTFVPLSCKNSKAIQQPPHPPEQNDFAPSMPTSKGTLVLFAGNLGGPGNINGSKSLARFISPTGIALDSNNNMYISDTDSSTIRKITSNGTVSTLAGSSLVIGFTDSNIRYEARFNRPRGIAIDSTGNVYVADTGNSIIRKISTTGAVSTFAGVPLTQGFLDGPHSSALFNKPEGIAVASNGDVYVADTGNNTVRKIKPDGTVSTIAGDALASASFNDILPGGTSLAARFNSPKGITIDASDNLYVVDSGNMIIRKIVQATGEVVTIAGIPTTIGSSDGNTRPFVPTSTVPLFDSPEGIAIDSYGALYVTDTNNQTIRKIVPDLLNPPNLIVSTIAGALGASGSADGHASARFSNPTGIAVSPSGDLYVTDTKNNSIRKINLGNGVSTFAGAPSQVGLVDSDIGSNARFTKPQALTLDAAGNLYVADTDNHSIRKVTPQGAVSTIAGFTQSMGDLDGAGSIASFSFPRGIAVDSSGTLYIADEGNRAIRRIVQSTQGPSTVSTLVTLGVKVFGLTIDNSINGSKNIYVAVADQGNEKLGTSAQSIIGRLNSTGGFNAVFGSTAGNIGFLEGASNSALFNMPQGVTIDSLGNVYVADTQNSVIRKISPAGLVSTIAGSPLTTGATDGSASLALFKRPRGIAVDSFDNLYVADSGNHLIRKITFSTDGSAATVSTVAGTLGLIGDSVGPLPGSLVSPVGLAVDNSGKNVIIYATVNNGIAKITLP